MTSIAMYGKALIGFIVKSLKSLKTPKSLSEAPFQPSRPKMPSIAAPISAMVNGWPLTLLSGRASTRY